MTNYHVTKNLGGGWNYKREGASGASVVSRTQAQAEREAKRLPSLTGGEEVRIHSEDSRIRDSDMVKPANDPNPSKDKKF